MRGASSRPALRRPALSTLSPYTTLLRSVRERLYALARSRDLSADAQREADVAEVHQVEADDEEVVHGVRELLVREDIHEEDAAEIGRAHGGTPVTSGRRMPSSA